MVVWFWPEFFACLSRDYKPAKFKGQPLRLWAGCVNNQELALDSQPSISTILKLLPSLRSFALPSGRRIRPPAQLPRRI